MNVYAKLLGFIIQEKLRNAHAYFSEKMIDIGYESENVINTGSDIVLWGVDFADEDVGKIPPYVEKVGVTSKEYIDNYIDLVVVPPKYTYDDTLEDPASTGSTKWTGGRTPTLRLPKSAGYKTGGKSAIYPGEYVDIDLIEEWVRTVKIQNDPELQMLTGTEFDNAVDSVVYKVSRKIYYVGRKPSNMTPEDWDNETGGMRPVEGTYSKRSGGRGKEDWTDGFPYGPDYEYRTGMFV